MEKYLIARAQRNCQGTVTLDHLTVNRIGDEELSTQGPSTWWLLKRGHHKVGLTLHKNGKIFRAKPVSFLVTA